MGLAINVKPYICLLGTNCYPHCILLVKFGNQLKMYLMVIPQTNEIVMDIAGKWIGDKYFLLENLQIAWLIMLFVFFSPLFIS